MPIIKSAKKALRQSIKRQAKNKLIKQKIKTVLKDARALAANKKNPDLSLIYKAIDKAAKKGILKPNTASRKKSRIAKLVAKSN